MLKNIPISIGSNANPDEVNASEYGAIMINGHVDSIGNVYKRPKRQLLCDLGTNNGIDGLYWWGRQSIVIAISNSRLFKITDKDGTFSEIVSDDFQKNQKGFFADYGDYLYGANGGRIIKIPTSGAASYMIDADAPTTVTHVDFIDKYLVANEKDTERAWRSDVDDPDSWTSNWVTTEYKPDLLLCLAIYEGSLFFPGKETIEVWYNDGYTPFVRESNPINTGLGARYSFTVCGKYGICLLDSERNVVRINGRSPVKISETLNKYISRFQNVQDSIGEFLQCDGKSWYLLNFLTEEKTIAIDLDLGHWSEWSDWDLENAEFRKFKGGRTCYCNEWGLSLIGDNSDGKIYKISETYDDDNGSMVRAVIRTPEIDYGDPSKRKFSEYVNLHFKRTESTQTVSTPKFILQWRDNGQTGWNNERVMDIGVTGETSFSIRLNRMGSYYTRQWQVVLPDAAPFALVKMQEMI